MATIFKIEDYKKQFNSPADLDNVKEHLLGTMHDYIRNNPQEIHDYVKSLHQMIMGLLSAEKFGINDYTQLYGNGADYTSGIQHIRIPIQQYERLQRINQQIAIIKEEF